MPSVQINEEILNRLRNFVALEYGGKVWGKISEHIEIAIRDYLDIKEGCHRDIITKRTDKIIYEPNYSGQRVMNVHALFMLSPKKTTQRIVIPAEKGYWMHLIIKGLDGKEISVDPKLGFFRETDERSSWIDYYNYTELKKEMPLKHKIHIKYPEKLVVYIEEDIGKIQDVEFEFAVDLCEK